jgi:hypothetical protein
MLLPARWLCQATFVVISGRARPHAEIMWLVCPRPATAVQSSLDRAVPARPRRQLSGQPPSTPAGGGLPPAHRAVGPLSAVNGWAHCPQSMGVRSQYLGTADLFVCFSGACLEEHSRRKKVAIVAERGHDFVAQFRVRTLHTNNQVNPGQRASKRFTVFLSHLNP